jgi:hypothetical protein
MYKEKIMKKFSEFVNEHNITGMMSRWYDMLECFNKNFPSHALDYTVVEGDMKKPYTFKFSKGSYIIIFNVKDGKFSIEKNGKKYDSGDTWQEYMKWALLDIGMDATALKKCK